MAGVDAAGKLGASAAKIALAHGEGRSCEFESGKLKAADSQETLSYTVSVVVDGRSGSTSGNRAEDVELMVERAVELARVGSNAHFETYPAPKPFVSVPKHSESTLSLTRERMIEAGHEIVDRLKSVDPELDIGAGAGLSDSEGIMVTSGGVCRATTGTSWSLYGGIQRTQGTDMLFSQAWRSWCELNELFDPAWICERIERDLRWAADVADPPKGDVPVYLPPSTLGMFLSPVLAGLNGRSVAKGTSPLQEHLGEEYFTKDLTIIDEPHIPYCPQAATMDSAGIPTQRTALIEKGIIRTFLYDLDSAGLAGAEPTGHAGCSPYFPLVSPGTEMTSDELLRSIDDGLYISQLLGFGQSNIGNGDFSSNVALGYRIRNGRIVGRVKDTMVAGNLFEIFKNPVRLSTDVEPQSRLPHAVVSGVSISS